MSATINGVEAPPRLLQLMQRPDRVGRRTDPKWLTAFGNPIGGFVEFISLDACEGESASLNDPKVSMLLGQPSKANPPGDIDPKRCFVIGFVDLIDFTINVDTRPTSGPSVTSASNEDPVTYGTAFHSIDEFADFYETCHGS